MNNKSILLLLLLIILFSCNIDWQYPDDTESQLYCKEKTKQIETTLLDVDIPASLYTTHPEKNGTELDINIIFTILDKLSIETGYFLDYVYYNDGYEGYPMCYIQYGNVTSFSTYQDYITAINNDLVPALDMHIMTDNTNEGFLQLALFHLLSNKFYLFWHAQYKEIKIISTYSDLENSIPSKNVYIEEIMPISYSSFVNQVRQLDIAWEVETMANETSIRIVTFSQFYGFEEHTFIFSTNFPHEIQHYNITLLLFYNCGLSY